MTDAPSSDFLLHFTSHIRGANAKVWVYADRIEWSSAKGVSAGKITAGILTGGVSLAVTGVGRGGYTTGAKKGTEVIPLRAVTSVTTRRDGALNSVLAVSTPAGVVDMRIAHKEAERAKQTITELMLAAQQQTVVVQHAAAPTASAVDVPAQIAKLAELHAAGILTDTEFADKKAQLLAQI
jgi:hypothetical protein